MRKLILAVIALATGLSVAYTVAFAQDAAKEAAKPAAAQEATQAPARHVTPRRSTPRLDKDGRPLSPKSTAERTALCRADCKPNNYKECGTWGCTGMHGLYRDYDK